VGNKSKDGPSVINTCLTFFNDLSLKEVVKRVEVLSQSESFAYVVTPNIDHLSRLCDTPEEGQENLQDIYRDADLSLCDSRILEKLLALRGKKPKAIIPGSDLTQYLFDRVLTSDDRLLVIGNGVSEIELLRKKYSHLNIDHINPSMGFIKKPDEVLQVVNKIISMKAHYIFLAVGSPRQEVLASKIKQSVGACGVGLCIGASINFLVGKETRAPKWVQTLNMEWLYRMLQDPKRLVKRYAMNAVYIPKIYSRLKNKQGCRS